MRDSNSRLRVINLRVSIKSFSYSKDLPTDLITIQQVHSHLLTTNSLLLNSTLLFNTLLRCYSLSDSPQQDFLLYKQLQQIYIHSNHSCPPLFDSFTYFSLIKTCLILSFPNMGMQLHAVIIKVGFESHVYVNTALVNMYVSLGFLVAGTKLFDEMPERNIVTWNVMITGLIKWGELEFARSLFEEMPSRSVVSWTGIIDGYTRMNRPREAFALFRRMVEWEYIEPSEITILAILPAVWQNGDVKSCQLVHGYGEKRGFLAFDIRVANCLIDTYAKCGCIASASRFFEEIAAERKNLVSWTSIISAFAMHGMGKEAVTNFERMEKIGLKPNRVTYLSVLSACSHGGLVEEGLKFFYKMVKECQVLPDIKHYGCLVDMLGRAGRLEEAEKIALEIPSEIANVIIWRTLLGSCSFHGNAEMGERVTRKILEMERGYGGDYVLMYNILAGVGRFGDAERLRRVMDERNAFKLPGHSMI
ncbi:pentatricopeptide repeat-containing protein At1g09220, mitochondrial-like [Pistacia vera]|uniref:pentatricopeptide repeat-containing protein At1g09220, mitochondrial-like n=1 Tax=Pistacia vera TaxID=55513 RepID=UPI0012637AAE|nr:pentatricopeptide repeat-containing protein At1g09220, mitochondrial-like [Pistacia vera]